MEVFWIWTFIVIGVSAVVILSRLASGIVAVTSGIKINKDKKSTFMGVTLILIGIEAILSIFGSVPVTILAVRLMRLSEKGVVTYNYLSTAVGLVAFLVGLSAIVFFSLYFIKNYQVGKIHLIVALIARLLTLVVSRFSNMLLASFSLKRSPLALYVTVFLVSVILSVVSSTAMILLAGKTRTKEPNRRALFIFPLIFMLFSEFEKIITMVYTVRNRSGGSGWEELILIVIPLAGAVLITAGSVYIVKTNKKITDEVQ